MISEVDLFRQIPLPGVCQRSQSYHSCRLLVSVLTEVSWLASHTSLNTCSCSLEKYCWYMHGDCIAKSDGLLQEWEHNHMLSARQDKVGSVMKHSCWSVTVSMIGQVTSFALRHKALPHLYASDKGSHKIRQWILYSYSKQKVESTHLLVIIGNHAMIFG